MPARVLQWAHAQSCSGGGLHADLCHDRVLVARRGSLRLRRHPQRLHRPLRRQQYQFEPPERLRQPLRDCVLPGHALRVPADRSNRLQHLVSVLQRRLRCREPDTVGDRPDSNQLQSCLLRAVQVVSGAAVLRSERDRLSMSWRRTRAPATSVLLALALLHQFLGELDAESVGQIEPGQLPLPLAQA